MAPNDHTPRDEETDRPVAHPGDPIQIGRLIDLEPHTDDIISALNADKQLALVAVVDPVGVLHDLGYSLNRQAAREIRRALPRLSRENRDRYLAWLRDLDPIPDTVDIKLVPRPSGRALLVRTAQTRQGSTQDSGNPGVTTGNGAGGFDVVVQTGDALAERMLQRHYADARMPRSVYRIGGKLHHYLHAGHYEDVKDTVGSADREIHVGKPTLQFLTNQTKRVRIVSPFVATGFAPQPLNGTATVDAGLTMFTDAHGCPHDVEVTFGGLKASDITVSLSAPAGSKPPSNSVQTELKKTMLSAYKDFRMWPGAKVPRLPLTFPLVVGDELVGQGATRKVNASFAVMTPTGATTPMLVVGLTRAGVTSVGDLSSVVAQIKPGGDLALVQDADWLEAGLNAGFVSTLPIRFDAGSGKLDENGDLRVDSIVWGYRAGGLTGALSGTQDDAFLWWNHSVRGDLRFDISFHSSEPVLTIKGSSDLAGMECWEKILFTILLVFIGAVAGGIIGAIIGAAAGGAAAVGAIIGGIAGGGVGLSTSLGLINWPVQFGAGGLPQTNATEQTIKVTHQQPLPEMSTSATVIPDGFEIDESGTRMSARVVGPTYEAVEPWVRIAGRHSVEIEPLPAASASSTQPGGTDDEVGEATSVATAGRLGPLPQGFSASEIEPARAGTISLDYRRHSTWGLQGALTHSWTYNGQPIGTGPAVHLDLAIPTEVVKYLEFNKVNVLGTLKLTVTDSFGRSASDSVTITVGSAKDFRAYRPRGIPDRFGGLDPDPFEDPLGRMRSKWPDQPVPCVGWSGDHTDVMASSGLLVAYTEFASPLTGEPISIAATTKEEALG